MLVFCSIIIALINSAAGSVFCACLFVCMFVSLGRYSDWNFFFVGGWRFPLLVDAVKLLFESVHNIHLPWAYISIPAKTKLLSDSFHFWPVWGTWMGCLMLGLLWIFFIILEIKPLFIFFKIWLLSFFSCSACSYISVQFFCLAICCYNLQDFLICAGYQLPLSYVHCRYFLWLVF